MVNNAAEAYKRQQVLTATPEALTLMLYNGALRFMTEGREAIEKNNFEEANTALQKAQRIITEFRVTLKWNMKYPINCYLFITTSMTVWSRLT
jgi:flagellar protein FliS